MSGRWYGQFCDCSRGHGPSSWTHGGEPVRKRETGVSTGEKRKCLPVCEIGNLANPCCQFASLPLAKTGRRGPREPVEKYFLRTGGQQPVSEPRTRSSGRNGNQIRIYAPVPPIAASGRFLSAGLLPAAGRFLTVCALSPVSSFGGFSVGIFRFSLTNSLLTRSSVVAST